MARTASKLPTTYQVEKHLEELISLNREENSELLKVIELMTLLKESFYKIREMAKHHGLDFDLYTPMDKKSWKIDTVATVCDKYMPSYKEIRNVLSEFQKELTNVSDSESLWDLEQETKKKIKELTP